MQTRTKRTLIYSFFLLFIMACRTWGCNNSETVKTADDTSGFSDDFRCHRFIQIAADLPLNGFACTLACPTGTHTFDLYDKEPKDFFTMTISEIQAQYCPGGAPAQLSGSDAQPTEPPTEEPAAIEPPTDPAPLNPFLTEEFTTCDNKARYVNFSIAENAPPTTPPPSKSPSMATRSTALLPPTIRASSPAITRPSPTSHLLECRSLSAKNWSTSSISTAERSATPPRSPRS